MTNKDTLKSQEHKRNKGYREINKAIRKVMKKAKEEWIEKQCTKSKKVINKVKEEWIVKQFTKIEENISKNNIRVYQIAKELMQRKQARVNNIEDREGNCLTEDKPIIDRWTNYCLELYNRQTQGDHSVLTSQDSSEEDDFTIL